MRHWKFWPAKSLCWLTSVLTMCALNANAQEIGCAAAASASNLACTYAAKDDLYTERGICMDSPAAGLDGCLDDARNNYDEVLEECGAIFESQQNVCDITADAAHLPEFGEAFAASFVDPLQIGITEEPNPWFPLVQGNSWVYEGTFEEDGEMITETIVVTVLPETKLIDGITCVVVRDVVTVDDELVEDTDDWFAQDVDGNVWYCGEEVKDYEFFDGDEPSLPELVSDDGSFKAGRDGDKGGVLLPKTPVVGELFRQELSVGNAEDVIEILATDADESSVVAACNQACLRTYDFSPLDPEAQENKYYAPNVGLIVEIDLTTGDRVELIEFNSL
ncbi:MAG: hypothetical protein DHS20C16_34560 [Phycisphaerae bacterium]|nr:MAG: hypothetical protein DHS20C16_34560 [Phycisphaerae bacterium]